MKFWKDIRKKYPAAFRQLLDDQPLREYRINMVGRLAGRQTTQHYQPRNLFDYFDSKKMYIEIEIEPVNRVYDIEAIDSFYAAIVINGNRTELPLLRTRQEAEESAFDYCFFRIEEDIKSVKKEQKATA